MYPIVNREIRSPSTLSQLCNCYCLNHHNLYLALRTSLKHHLPCAHLHRPIASNATSIANDIGCTSFNLARPGHSL
jgi:hypothetical protein